MNIMKKFCTAKTGQYCICIFCGEQNAIIDPLDKSYDFGYNATCPKCGKYGFSYETAYALTYDEQKALLVGTPAPDRKLARQLMDRTNKNKRARITVRVFESEELYPFDRE